MKTTDEQIFEWYMFGYEDECFGTSRTVSDDKLLNEAYDLGVSHVTTDRKYNVIQEVDVIKIIRKQ